MHLLKGAEFITPGASNRIPHQGKLVQLNVGDINKLYAGCAAVAFDLPIVIRVRGEQSLFFNIKDKGLVCVTGCCHQSILTMADFGQQKIAGDERTCSGSMGPSYCSFQPTERKGGEKIVKGFKVASVFMFGFCHINFVSINK